MDFFSSLMTDDVSIDSIIVKTSVAAIITAPADEPSGRLFNDLPETAVGFVMTATIHGHFHCYFVR